MVVNFRKKWSFAIFLLLVLNKRATALSLSQRRDFFILIGTASVSETSLTARPRPALALTSSQAELQYDAYSSSYDQLDGGQASSALGIDDARRDLMKFARGRVLEVGAGTGINLRHYPSFQVSSLALVDISDGMLQQAKIRASSLDNLRGVPVKAFKADATTDLVSLFGAESFDTVVDTFSLCVMGTVGAQRCLDQMGQVVKRDGTVLLLENSRSSNPLLGIYQDLTADAAASSGGKGCVYNQDVTGLIRSTGRLEIQSETPFLAGLFRSYVCLRSAA